MCIRDSLTIHSVAEVYDVILWSSSIGYYGIVDEIDLNGLYIETDNIMGLNENEMCIYNVRLIYDDGG